jgi:exonuclease III
VRFGTWNVRSLYRAGSLTAAARKLARHKLDLLGVQEVRLGQKRHGKRRGL